MKFEDVNPWVRLSIFVAFIIIGQLGARWIQFSFKKRKEKKLIQKNSN